MTIKNLFTTIYILTREFVCWSQVIVEIFCKYPTFPNSVKMIVFTVHHDTHCPGQTLEETLVKSARPEQPVESSVGLQPFRILHCTTRSFRQFYQRQSVTMKFLSARYFNVYNVCLITFCSSFNCSLKLAHSVSGCRQCIL